MVTEEFCHFIFVVLKPLQYDTRKESHLDNYKTTQYWVYSTHYWVK